MANKLPTRSQVNKKYTWNAESVFKNQKAWEAELKAVLADLPTVKQFQGRLSEGPQTLRAALEALEKLTLRAYHVLVYAQFSYAVDTTDQNATGMMGKAQGMFGQVAAATAFLRPELLQVGRETLTAWMQAEPTLAVHAHNIDDLFRRQKHVRSIEVEELLGMVSEALGGSRDIGGMLTNADFKFAPAVDAKGKKVEVTQGTIHTQLMVSPDRKLRQSAWNSYMDRHVEFKNTLSANLATSIKANVFYMRARQHESSLAASLFDTNIPVEVFHNLINTFKQNLPVWHRYFEIRRKALGQRDLAPYDMWAPIAPKKVKIPFEQAVEYICAGLAPMGQAYVDIVRKGCLKERWVDVYPNQGKQNGAFSWGAPGTHPFIMMSYTDEVFSMSTLAHELGHSMHSYLTWQNQPLTYADYSLFVAEVASNFHQAMVRGYLLRQQPDKNFQIALLEEAMANFFRYFFIMPTLARFELATHESVEQGQPLAADGMIKLMADLFAEGYGPKVKLDRPRVGMTWATFGHLFQDYYVYQYATGISGAHALSGRILRGEPKAVEDYLAFLKSGSSGYPLDVLKKAGVDLTTPKAVEETFAVMSSYIDRLESLVG